MNNEWSRQKIEPGMSQRGKTWIELGDNINYLHGEVRDFDVYRDRVIEIYKDFEKVQTLIKSAMDSMDELAEELRKSDISARKYQSDADDAYCELNTDVLRGLELVDKEMVLTDIVSGIDVNL